jgi:septal ring factor EnvC (AmiA/AmiB activator)
MAYYGYLNRSRQRQLRAVTEQARALETLAQKADEEVLRLGKLAARKDEMRTRLLAAQAERQARLAELDRGIAAGRTDIADLAADAEALRRVIEQLARQAEIAAEADVQQVPFAQRRGKLAWPLARVALLAQFGAPRGTDGQRWDGVVLAATEGAEVRALHHGRVVYADWLRGFGLLAVIDHGDGYMSLYGNNQTLLKEVGDWVEAGDVVALTGSSGGQNAAQLYFAIRYRGQPQDPRLWCRDLQPTARAGG